MARRITPVAIRLERGATHPEVLTASGSWVSWALLPDYNKEAVRLALAGRAMPTFGQTIYLAEKPEQPEQPSPQPVPQPSPDVAPVDTDDMDDMDGQPQPSPDNTPAPAPNGPQMQTIEDIVRRIAGELDDDVRAEVSAELLGAMDKRIEDFLANNPPVTPSPIRNVIERVEIKVNEVVLQKDGLFHMSMPDLLFNVQIGEHTYLPGSPGTGKSHAAQQVAETLGWMFRSISFGPTTPESRLTGGMTADGRFFEPALLELIRHAMANPDSGSVMCLDEMDNGHPGVQATLNSLLANGWMTAPNGDHLTVGKNMVFVACANTYGTGPTAEFSGRNKLDAATLDRFLYLPWEIDEGLEEVLVRAKFSDDEQGVASAWLDAWRTARGNVAEHGLKVFVTPRGAIKGAKQVAAGRPIDKALMQTLGNKVPADQWKKINPL